MAFCRLLTAGRGPNVVRDYACTARDDRGHRQLGQDALSSLWPVPPPTRARAANGGSAPTGAGDLASWARFGSTTPGGLDWYPVLTAWLVRLVTRTWVSGQQSRPSRAHIKGRGSEAPSLRPSSCRPIGPNAVLSCSLPLFSSVSSGAPPPGFSTRGSPSSRRASASASTPPSFLLPPFQFPPPSTTPPPLPVFPPSLVTGLGRYLPTTEKITI